MYTHYLGIVFPDSTHTICMALWINVQRHMQCMTRIQLASHLGWGGADSSTAAFGEPSLKARCSGSENLCQTEYCVLIPPQYIMWVRVNSCVELYLG